jgi:hypothetical protein
VLAALIVACSDPDAQRLAATEPVTTQTAALGSDAGATAAHGAIVWQDATGAVVPFFLEFGFGGSAYTDESGGMFLDSNGIMWAFGPYACGGPLTICPPYASYNNTPNATFWDGTNCTGTAYVPYVHGHVAFTLQGPTGTTVRALNSNANVALQFLQSSYSTSCTNGAIVHILAAPLTDAPVVTPPAALPFTPPLQPVMLN